MGREVVNMRLGCGLPKPGKVSRGGEIMCDGTGVCYRIDWAGM